MDSPGHTRAVGEHERGRRPDPAWHGLAGRGVAEEEPGTGQPARSASAAPAPDRTAVGAPEQVVAIAAEASALVGLWAGLLIITAAWTGARWGELTGLQRRDAHLDDGEIVTAPQIGAGRSQRAARLGPPKTPCSARTISLPPFLIPPLRDYLDRHDHPHAEHQL